VSRAKIWLFGSLATVGTLLIVFVAASVAGEAKTSLDVALLVFTGAAAAIGWLGLVVSWLTFRLEAGRVPRPDVKIIDEGSLVSHWKLRLVRQAPRQDIERILEAEREQLARAKEASKRRSRKGGTLSGYEMFSSLISAPSEDDLRRFDKRVETYLSELRQYLTEKQTYDEFWSISRPLLLAFTNDRGGAPADGVLVRLHFPDPEQGLVVQDASDLPDEPDVPSRPAPPKGRSFLDDLLYRPSLSDFLGHGLGALGRIAPPGNVSGPDFEQGSVLVKYKIDEILHNVPEDNRNESLVVTFQKPGTWEIPYEIHARNLQAHRTGRLMVDAVLGEPGTD
jgi:hypothetical protein